VSETLRKYPIVPFLDRISCSKYELPATTGNGTITLPAGTGVYIPVFSLHHDPTYFPEPEKFDPDRFTEENKHSRPNYTYIPFGEGPRMCLGMRFGLMQVKTGLCHILSRFELAPCKETAMHITFNTKSFFLQPHGDIRLSFKRTLF
jgi:cytochrome P450 family 6